MPTCTDQSDRELLDAARGGPPEAFRRLVERYESQVAATVIGMLGRCQEAQDVGQEVFIRLYRSLDRFRGDARLGTYLTRIAINLSLNEIKRRKRYGERHTDAGDDLAEMADPADTTTQRVDMADVRRAILGLDPKSRAVVVLRLVEGHSTQQTADILKLPLGTVLSRLSRAQHALRETLKEYREVHL
jgi:RNA polymerase sigma-70 factor, ECF subfamily